MDEGEEGEEGDGDVQVVAGAGGLVLDDHLDGRKELRLKLL